MRFSPGFSRENAVRERLENISTLGDLTADTPRNFDSTDALLTADCRIDHITTVFTGFSV